MFPSPSCVAKWRPSLTVIVTDRASRAVMLAHSGNFPVIPAACGGGATLTQCSPSMVRAIAPLRPTSQQTASETTAPASQSSLDGLACEPHVFPASMERSMAPPFPARQRLEPDGAFNNEEK